MVVDDDDLFRDMLVIMLQRERPACQITTAQNGQDAYAVYQQHGADLIVTDDIMPVMSGMALVQMLRVEQQTVPVVMLTSRYTTRTTIVPDAYTMIESKPIGMRRLLTIIDWFLLP